ncbi:MAG: cysteine hydrolase [Microbacteriaceae bacterium]|nr:cysteine hydrolase [Microbacteriaceae bacterium]
MNDISEANIPALIVIDVQYAFDDFDFWGQSTNPECEANIAALIDYWQKKELPIIVVRHDSRGPKSPLHPDNPGNRLKDFVAEAPAKLLVSKHVNSAFYGTPDLHEWLSASGYKNLIICGIQTNMCVETTTRMAGNLGYQVTVALDATRTFDIVSDSGTLTAAELMKSTAVNLSGGGFARIASTADLLKEI